LDPESDALIHKALEELRAERKTTVIVISHRLSTVLNADKIGKIY
jgi:ABC-type multidrug transport system fused ATPase/permease subunit